MALIAHLPAERVSTISSAPAEFTDLPPYVPRAVEVTVVQATSPRTLTSTGVRVVLTARAKAMSAGR